MGIGRPPWAAGEYFHWGISHWLSSGLGSDPEPSLSWATSVNTLQLGSEIPSLHSKSEPNFVHTGGSGQAQLWPGSALARLRNFWVEPELSQCEMPHCLFGNGSQKEWGRWLKPYNLFWAALGRLRCMTRNHHKLLWSQRFSLIFMIYYLNLRCYEFCMATNVLTAGIWQNAQGHW